MTVLSIQQWHQTREEEKVGLAYDRVKLCQAKMEMDETEPDYTVCDCGERVEFGQTLSGMSGMCDGGHVWWNDGGEWKSVNLLPTPGRK